MASNSDHPDGAKRVRRVTKKASARRTDGPPVIDPEAGGGGAARRFGALLAMGGVRKKDVTIFLRQLIMMLEAGTPLLKALKTLSERGSMASRALVRDIAGFVEAGNPLWQAFERHPRYFDSVFVNLIKASEASGTLSTVLERLVSYREKREMMMKRLRGGMFYPVILVAACIGAVIFLNIMVIPTFREFFEGEGMALPRTTEFALWLSDFIKNTWFWALLVVVALVLVYKFWFVRNPLWRIKADRVKLSIPVMGSIVQKNAIAEMTRTLGMLLRSGLPMMTSLDLVRASIHNKAVAHTLQDLRDAVEQGGGIEETLRARRRIIPPVVTDMMVTGEESGQLDQISEQIAQAYEEDLNISIATLGEAIQPILTVFLGCVVLFVVLAFFLPMISMIDQMGAGN